MLANDYRTIKLFVFKIEKCQRYYVELETDVFSIIVY